MYREAKAIHNDPVDAFHPSCPDPAKRAATLTHVVGWSVALDLG